LASIQSACRNFCFLLLVASMVTLVLSRRVSEISELLLPRDALQCNARYCDRMSSVCPSVTLVNCDHVGWNSSKIISPLVSMGRSLFATPTSRVCSKGNTLNLGPKLPTPVDLSVGDIRSQIAAE